MSNIIRQDSDHPLTPVSEAGVKALFDGLCAISETLIYSAPAGVAIAVTPSLRDLLEQFCRFDPRYPRVMANVWVQEYQSMKHHSL